VAGTTIQAHEGPSGNGFLAQKPPLLYIRSVAPHPPTPLP
jgi:hypothetical protein